MPRAARVVVPDHAYHVTQRGNGRQPIFLSDDDRRRYLAWIQHYSSQYQLSLLAYCLMDNHVHFIALPKNREALAKTFSIAHMRYAQYFNTRRHGSGHLWQGRFYSCLLDDSYLMAAMRYVERNPVRAKLVKQPWHWPWSSAATHVGHTAGRINLQALNSVTELSAEAWKQFIDTGDGEEDIRTIRQHTMTGRPLGPLAFVTKLSETIGRRLQALPRGRPKKNA
jgi:REP-associated tyrosine transposase